MIYNKLIIVVIDGYSDILPSFNCCSAPNNAMKTGSNTVMFVQSGREYTRRKPGGSATIIAFPQNSAEREGRKRNPFIPYLCSSSVVGLGDPQEELQALKTAHARDTKELAVAYKRFALANKGGITDSQRKKEQASTALDIAERLLTLKIAEFSPKLDNPDDTVAEDAQRLTLALFLLERTTQIRDAALKKNQLGTYALYVSLRDDVCKMLASDYYQKNFTGIIHVYLDLEPQIIAASGICGILPPPSVAEIPDLYKKVLRARIV
jgi:hypothetical protein